MAVIYTLTFAVAEHEQATELHDQIEQLLADSPYEVQGLQTVIVDDAITDEERRQLRTSGVADHDVTTPGGVPHYYGEVSFSATGNESDVSQR
jgi:hypothetical protein